MNKIYYLLLLFLVTFLAACTSNTPVSESSPEPAVNQSSASSMPSSSATASPNLLTWNSWTNTTQNYVVSYPSTWFIYKNGEAAVGTNTTAISNSDLTVAKKAPSDFMRINISIFDATEKTASDLKTQLTKDKDNVLKAETVSVNGMEGVRIVTEGLGKNTSYYLIGKKNSYYLSFGADYTDKSTQVQTALQIVDSFKEK